MKIALSLLLLTSLSACAPLSNPERIYLKNTATKEIVVCEEGHFDSIMDLNSFCVSQKERNGFNRITVTKFNHFGYPIEYTVEEDPFFPNK